jgi:hypothetical protein
MKNSTKNFVGKEYAVPTIETYSVNVEQGFQASVPGVTINPWESDNDTLEF